MRASVSLTELEEGRPVSDEISALADDAPIPTPAVEPAAAPVPSPPAITMQALRVPVGLMLDTIPNAMALQFNDSRFALSEKEKEAGVDAWCLLLEILFPDAEKLAKVFALLGAGLWTFNVAVPRIMMAKARKRQGARQANRPERVGADHEDTNPEDEPDIEGAE